MIPPKSEIDEINSTQLANPSAYSTFITEDLPIHLSFLALFALGQSLEATRDNEVAIRAINEAIKSVELTTENQSQYIEALFHLGWLHHQQFELNKALEKYNQILSINPEEGSVYNNRALSIL